MTSEIKLFFKTIIAFGKHQNMMLRIWCAKAHAMAPSISLIDVFSAKMRQGFINQNVRGTTWLVPHRYVNLTLIGHGAYSNVCSAFDSVDKHPVAIKKLTRPFHGDSLAQRTYREIMLLKHIDHENVIMLYDVFTPDESYENFQSVYLVTPLMDATLCDIMRYQRLSDSHTKFLMYQLLRGLKYLHSANLIHRDLKPVNIGVNGNCDLRILDLGLARLRDGHMTGYVTTRHYRAPDVMLLYTHYSASIDIWSVGCILAELISGRVLFPGDDCIDQIKRTLSVTGFPDSDYMQLIESKDSIEFLKSYQSRLKYQPLSQICPEASPLALDLMQKLLTLNPEKRITAAQALQHEYFADYHDPNDEPDSMPYTDQFDQSDFTCDQWKLAVWNLINDNDNQ